GAFQDPARAEGLSSRAGERRRDGLPIHRFEGIRRRAARVAPVDAELSDVRHRHGADSPAEDAGESGRKGDGLSVRWTARARARKPSVVDLTPGVPDSMKSCASKWDRVAFGLPAA